MTITPELKAELLAILRQEMAEQEREKKANKSVFQRVMQEFEPELKQFNWTETRDGTRPDGTAYHREEPHNMEWKIRNAIGVLLQATYKTNGVAHLPTKKEAEIKEFTRAVILLMHKKALRRGAGR